MFRSILSALFLCLSASSFASSYKVLSWNTFFLPDYLKTTYHDERLPKLVKALEQSDYDFIFLQEVFTNSSYFTLDKAMRARGFYSSGKPFRRFYKPFSSGLVIFSRYPLSDVKIMLFDELVDADKYSSKGVLFAKATLPSGDKVQLATTHFQSKKGKRFRVIRQSHLTQITDIFLRVFNNTEIPVIFGGDFNIGNNYGGEYEKFLSTFKDLRLITGPPVGGQRYTSDCVANSLKNYLKPDCILRKQVDYIFYRKKNTESHNKSLDFSESFINPTVIDFKDNYKTKDGMKNLSLSDHMSVEAILDL